jgi:hypothetical protein
LTPLASWCVTSNARSPGGEAACDSPP